MKENILGDAPCIIDFCNFFNDEKAASLYLENIRWKENVICPKCGGEKIYILKNYKQRFDCASPVCRYTFSVKARTIFDNTKLPLNKWFLILYFYSQNKKNIASAQNARNVRVTQTTAWHAMHKIRSMLSDDYEKLSGIVEIDEVFLARKKPNYLNFCSLSIRKAPILGMFQRGGKVLIKTIPNRRPITLDEIILKHVEKGSTIYTDGWMGYKNLSQYYNHEWVNHKEGEYVREATHTNNIESVWGYMKKSIRAAHHNVSQKHAQLYCDEIAYKYNRRDWKPMDIFNDLLTRAVNPINVQRQYNT